MVSDYFQSIHKKILSGVYNRNPLILLLKLILLLISIPLFIINTLRAWFFKVGLKNQYHSKIKVISVGNITVGGTGKTPFCIMLLKLFLEQDKMPALVSRGYGKDESQIYQKHFPNIKLQFNPSRVTAIKAIESSKEGTDVIVLDDAFQHQNVFRDLNILLVDVTNPFGYGYFLPRGLLRESPKAAKRASAIVFTHSVKSNLNEYINTWRPYTNQDCLYFTSSHMILKIENNEFQNQTKESLKNKNILLVSGIAHPNKFELLLKNESIEFQNHIIFGDHHSYTAEDFGMIDIKASDYDVILTTEKDIVKFNDSFKSLHKTYTVFIHLEVHQKKVFESYILGNQNENK